MKGSHFLESDTVILNPIIPPHVWVCRILSTNEPHLSRHLAEHHLGDIPTTLLTFTESDHFRSVLFRLGQTDKHCRAPMQRHTLYTQHIFYYSCHALNWENKEVSVKLFAIGFEPAKANTYKKNIAFSTIKLVLLHLERPELTRSHDFACTKTCRIHAGSKTVAAQTIIWIWTIFMFIVSIFTRLCIAFIFVIFGTYYCCFWREMWSNVNFTRAVIFRSLTNRKKQKSSLLWWFGQGKLLNGEINSVIQSTLSVAMSWKTPIYQCSISLPDERGTFHWRRTNAIRTLMFGLWCRIFYPAGEYPQHNSFPFNSIFVTNNDCSIYGLHWFEIQNRFFLLVKDSFAFVEKLILDFWLRKTKIDSTPNCGKR